MSESALPEPPLRELALCAGVGGLLATHHILGWRCVGYVEKAEYPCKVIEARIKDGLLSPAPIFHMHTGDFIRLGLAEKYRGLVDVISAGFPCQPFSSAGKKLGHLDDRNAWPDIIEIIRLVEPRFCLLENVSRLVSNPYFGTVLGDLVASGYDCRWDCIPASAIGAPHERDRLWIVAHANDRGRGEQKNGHAGPDLDRIDPPPQQGRLDQPPAPGNGGQVMANTEILHERELRKETKAERGQWDARLEPGRGGSRQPERETAHTLAYANGQEQQLHERSLEENARFSDDLAGSSKKNLWVGRWWETEPPLGRVVDGLADWLDLIETLTGKRNERLAKGVYNEEVRAIGNGQVPAAAAAAWTLLSKTFLD